MYSCLAGKNHLAVGSASCWLYLHVSDWTKECGDNTASQTQHYICRLPNIQGKWQGLVHSDFSHLIAGENVDKKECWLLVWLQRMNTMTVACTRNFGCPWLNPKKNGFSNFLQTWGKPKTAGKGPSLQDRAYKLQACITRSKTDGCKDLFQRWGSKAKRCLCSDVAYQERMAIAGVGIITNPDSITYKTTLIWTTPTFQHCSVIFIKPEEWSCLNFLEEQVLTGI